VPEVKGSWDPERLRRAFGALIASAIGRSSDEGVVSIKVTRQTVQSREWATIAVRDRGLGTPGARLPFVFEKGRRIEHPDGQVDTRATDLANTRRIVELHGGSVSVASEEGFGSTYTVRLPLLPPADDARPTALPEKETTGPTRLRRQRWDAARRADFLASVPVFRSLPPSALRSVAASSRVRAARRGEFVFLEGEAMDALHVLVEGRIKLIRETSAGREVIIRLVRPGEVFGIVGVGADLDYSVSALVQEGALVLQLPRGEVNGLLNAYPKFAKAMLQLLGANTRVVETRICDLQTESAERRTARVLLQLAARSEASPASGAPIVLALSRQDLSELAGTNQGTASRTLSAWARRGIVRGKRARVVILDLPALRAIVEGSSPLEAGLGDSSLAA
jgi:CRP-like cAMP-binding protein